MKWHLLCYKTYKITYMVDFPITHVDSSPTSNSTCSLWHSLVLDFSSRKLSTEMCHICSFQRVCRNAMFILTLVMWSMSFSSKRGRNQSIMWPLVHLSLNVFALFCHFLCCITFNVSCMALTGHFIPRNYFAFSFYTVGSLWHSLAWPAAYGSCQLSCATFTMLFPGSL